MKKLLTIVSLTVMTLSAQADVVVNEGVLKMGSRIHNRNLVSKSDSPKASTGTVMYINYGGKSIYVEYDDSMTDIIGGEELMKLGVKCNSSDQHENCNIIKTGKYDLSTTEIFTSGAILINSRHQVPVESNMERKETEPESFE